MSDRNEGAMAAIFSIAVVIIGVVSVIALAVIAGALAQGFALHALAQGFVLHKLWGWFIAPKFGLPPLGVMEAFALMLTVKLVTGKALGEQKDEAVESIGTIAGRFGKFFLGCGIVLLIGWILTFFVSCP